MVAILLRHQAIDVTIINNAAIPATWKLSSDDNNAKTINWVRIFLSTLLAYTNKHQEKKIILKERTEGFLNCLKSTVTINFLVSRDTSDHENGYYIHSLMWYPNQNFGWRPLE